MQPFEGYDFTNFWNLDSEDNTKYNCGELTQNQITSCAEVIQHTIPTSYLEMLKTQNGGVPNYPYFPIEHEEFDAIEIFVIYGIGDKDVALNGTYGQRYAVEHMGYPDKGIYFADTTQEGMLLLTPMGTVCYVNQQDDYTIKEIAPSLEVFISMLIANDNSSDAIENDDKDEFSL